MSAGLSMKAPAVIFDHCMKVAGDGSSPCLVSPLHCFCYTPRVEIAFDASAIDRTALEVIGDERTPILVVDGVLQNYETVCTLAHDLHYSPTLLAHEYYPGYHARAEWVGGLGRLRRTLARKFVREHFSDVFELDEHDPLPKSASYGKAFFALFAPQPEEAYTIIHTDPHSWLSAIIYLEGGEKTGTALWRHEGLGVESFVNSEDPGQHALLESLFSLRSRKGISAVLSTRPNASFDEIRRTILGPPRTDNDFPAVDHGPWKLLRFVKARPNRLVVFPTWQFHSIGSSRPIRGSQSLENTRKTLNIFIDAPFIDRPIMRSAPVLGLRTHDPLDSE